MGDVATARHNIAKHTRARLCACVCVCARVWVCVGYLFKSNVSVFRLADKTLHACGFFRIVKAMTLRVVEFLGIVFAKLELFGMLILHTFTTLFLELQFQHPRRLLLVVEV